ncbi:unnamed protein product [Rhizoctonia solani]|uniref:Uncharacterized protein n=1 Tax=Rhizoctonia solani TaxID=456999 RepID=A0A8H3GVN6_9AGAM|nr:unnamed protein product [Rhizoctonia solani]
MQTVNKVSFSHLLNEAQEKAYTEKNILSAFEATGLLLFNPYQTSVMQEFTVCAQTVHMLEKIPIPAPLFATHRYSNQHKVAERCWEVLSNTTANVNKLRKGLSDLISVYKGTEAQEVILKSKKEQSEQAEQERKAKKPQGGQIGHAYVYSQVETEEIHQQKEVHKQAEAA